MASRPQIRESFALLVQAGFRPPRDADGAQMVDVWAKVLDGVSDQSLGKAIDRYIEGEDRGWPQPGVILNAVTGGYQPTTYWSEDDDPDYQPFTAEDFRRIMRENGYDYEAERRAGLARHARDTLEG